MARLIDAEKLFKEIVEAYDYEYPTASGDFDEFVTKVLPNVFADAPTVEPRKHGHWIESGKFDKHDNKYGRHDYVCSECRGVAINFVGGTEDWWCFHKPKYCPECGAKMDGKDESDGIS